MATEERSDQTAPDKREPISPAKRKRLQMSFEHASKQMAQGNYDYATELLTQCVLGDPGNVQYVQSFLANLQKKYSNNKSGSKLAAFKARSERSSIKKGKAQGDWEAVLRNGLEVLKVNPWDVPALTAMADACEALHLENVTLIYLKMALDANPNDPDVNLQCAQALRARQQWDQAIACLHRVEKVRPDDEEIQRMIADLAVEKTIHQGRLEEDGASRKTSSATKTPQQQALSEEERLEREIAQDPKNISKYLELADLYLREDRFDKAEDVMARAYEASGGDPDIRDRWDDIQLRHLRYQVIQAKRKADETGSDEAKEEYKRLRKKQIAKELEYYKGLCERFPNNLTYKYELGVRYQLNGQYADAIREFQAAKNDPRRKGACLLALGQCFQQIHQLQLAMTHYEMSIQEIPDREAQRKKEALYLAGKLAAALKDFERAEKHLTALAGIDFNYRDVSALLTKVSEAKAKRLKGESSET